MVHVEWRHGGDRVENATQERRQTSLSNAAEMVAGIGYRAEHWGKKKLPGEKTIAVKNIGGDDGRGTWRTNELRKQETNCAERGQKSLLYGRLPRAHKDSTDDRGGIEERIYLSGRFHMMSGRASL